MGGAYIMRKTLKEMLLLVVVAVLFISIISSMQVQAAAKLNTSKKMVYVGESFDLKVKGISGKVKWSSSDKSVASVTQKGRVTAKKAGKATIIAKVLNKKLKCIVTVKKKFTPSDARKNISFELYDVKRGIIAILKNNNDVPVEVEATMLFYDAGELMGTTENFNIAFESGKTCALWFSAPDGDIDLYAKYDDYDMSMRVSRVDKSFVCVVDKIEVDSQMVSDSVRVNVSNTSGEDLVIMQVSIVFYDSLGQPIASYCESAFDTQDGDTINVDFAFPTILLDYLPDDYVEGDEIIYPSDYKIYVNTACGEKW